VLLRHLKRGTTINANTNEAKSFIDNNGNVVFTEVLESVAA